jgi:predicted RNase H-like nuclease (RuvC/YqgF family)
MSELKSRLELILKEVETLCYINKQLNNEIFVLKKELSELNNDAKLEGYNSGKLKHSEVTVDDIDALIQEVNECIEMVKVMA